MDLRTDIKQLGANREGEKKEVQCEIRVHQDKLDLSDELNEDKSEEVIEDWSGSRKSVGRTGGVRCAHREVKIEEADGGSSWEEGVGFAFLVLRGE